MLKAEKVNVTLYGFSSKRYALFRWDDGRIELVDYKFHGLGHLVNPFPNSQDDWHSRIWLDITAMHFVDISPTDIEKKYAGLCAVSRLTMSTPIVLQRFKILNERKEWKEQIKPFNFFLVGFQVHEADGRLVKSLSQHSRDNQRIVH